MEEITGYSFKHSLSATGLGWKFLNSFCTEEDEPVYTYNDKYMRWFIRQSIKGGRFCAFIQYYKSKVCDDVLKISWEGLNVKRNVFDNFEAYMKFKNEHLKIIKVENESKFNDYRDIHEEELNNYINKNLGEIPIHN